MYITWKQPKHVFVVGGREYHLGGTDAVHVPDADAAHIFVTHKWAQALLAGDVLVHSDAQHAMPAHEPMLSNEERLKRKAASKATQPAPAPPAPVEEG